MPGLVTTGTTWSGQLPSTKGELQAKVCALYGFDVGDPDLANRALGWLDESIQDLNYNTWENTRVLLSGLTITASTQTIGLPTLYYKSSQAYLVPVNASVDAYQFPMTYIPWVHFKRLYPDTGGGNRTGRPSIYSLFNTESEGLIYLYPVPDSDTATKFTLSVEYYQRLPKLSTIGLGAALSIPAEFESVILYGAYKRAAMHLGEAQDVSMYSRLESESLERMKRIDSMQPDADRRFRLINDSYGGYRWANSYIYPF